MKWFQSIQSYFPVERQINTQLKKLRGHVFETYAMLKKKQYRTPRYITNETFKPRPHCDDRPALIDQLFRYLTCPYTSVYVG